jgi:hypothetical protein
MVLKMFKAMWFLSMVAVLANLLYVYAGLPPDVIIQDDETSKVVASREFLFYAMTFVLMVVNVLVYVAARTNRTDEDFRSWLHGLLITINLFFILALNFIQTYNSAEKFDYNSIGAIIYGSVILIVLWAAAWPAYNLFRKFFPKQAVS